MEKTVLEARPGALEEMSSASLFVLDIDGVILDPAPSFYLAARQTANWAAERALGHSNFEPVSDNDVGSFKAVGGFNDDYDLACGAAWAVVARQSIESSPSIATVAGWSEGEGLSRLISEVSSRLSPEVLASAEKHCAPTLVRERCAARYSGKLRCEELYGIDPQSHADLPDDGLWHLEPLLVDSTLLQKLPVPLAFCTGRNQGETLLAQQRHGLSVPKDYWMVDDGVLPKKPAPDGLLRLAQLVKSAAQGELRAVVGQYSEGDVDAGNVKLRGSESTGARLEGSEQEFKSGTPSTASENANTNRLTELSSPSSSLSSALSSRTSFGSSSNSSSDPSSARSSDPSSSSSSNSSSNSSSSSSSDALSSSQSSSHSDTRPSSHSDARPSSHSDARPSSANSRMGLKSITTAKHSDTRPGSHSDTLPSFQSDAHSETHSGSPLDSNSDTSSNPADSTGCSASSARTSERAYQAGSRQDAKKELSRAESTAGAGGAGKVTDSGDVGKKPGPLVFVGDSVDDQRAALAYRQIAESSPELGLPSIVFVRVISAAATGTTADEAIASGADLVVTSLDPLIRQVYFGARS